LDGNSTEFLLSQISYELLLTQKQHTVALPTGNERFLVWVYSFENTIEEFGGREEPSAATFREDLLVFAVALLLFPESPAILVRVVPWLKHGHYTPWVINSASPTGGVDHSCLTEGHLLKDGWTSQ
jgi:hypothetical protein